MPIFFILQWMNGMKRCGVLRQLANASEGYYIAIVFSSAQITVWRQEGLVCFAHKISIYLDLLHNFSEPWSAWCLLSIRDRQLLRVHHSSCSRGRPRAPSSHLALGRREVNSSQRQRTRWDQGAEGIQWRYAWLWGALQRRYRTIIKSQKQPGQTLPIKLVSKKFFPLLWEILHS